MLNQSVREGLEAELEHLEAEKRQMVGHIEAKIAAIKKVLALDDEQADMTQPNLPVPDFAGRELPSGHGGNGSLAGKGIRESIRSVLMLYPRGLRPVELALKMEERGFRPNGKTPTKHLVNGELNRLYRSKKMVRRQGRYRLPPENDTRRED